MGEKPYRKILVREDGGLVRYDYIRVGNFPEGNPSQTAIDVVYLNQDGDEVGGECVVKYVNGFLVIARVYLKKPDYLVGLCNTVRTEFVKEMESATIYDSINNCFA